jgi:hypothetical protein
MNYHGGHDVGVFIESGYACLLKRTVWLLSWQEGVAAAVPMALLHGRSASKEAEQLISELLSSTIIESSSSISAVTAGAFQLLYQHMLPALALYQLTSGRPISVRQCALTYVRHTASQR